MITRIIVITVMLIIFVALISGLFFLVRDEGKSNRTVTALTWRIGLSIVLFLFLFVSFRLGWIHPHAL